ncbi:MAG TPA: TadE/TadG family type IV pilus assembly protein [Roseiflexaceae bacterium]|nr:TadE/TadG family type IV pilus assembly protein [Roseiflexaceae bacterium]
MKNASLGRLLRDERGAELVEFLGFLPLVLMIIVVGWQFALVGYTGVVAASAAREGARAAAAGEDAGQAVVWASPGFDRRREWTSSGVCFGGSGQPVTVRVQLEVPHVAVPFLGSLGVRPKVSASATLRCEPPYEAP